MLVAVSLLAIIIYQGSFAFKHHYIVTKVDFLAPPTTAEAFERRIKEHLIRANTNKRTSLALISSLTINKLWNDYRASGSPNNLAINTPMAAYYDQALKHSSVTLSEYDTKVLTSLNARGVLKLKWHLPILFNSDSQLSEQAGMKTAVIGTLLSALIYITLTAILGISTAIYLEEFAPNKWWVRFVEANINNLAAVPSIIYGIVGLMLFINALGAPRASAIVAGLTFTLMIIPGVIVSARQALASVPSSIKHAAIALGASPVKALWHHTIPLAMPQLVTSLILALARAMGETAPLLVIGMVAFILGTDYGFIEPTTTLPVQIYLWATNMGSGFAENTAAASLVLLILLFCCNLAVIRIRSRQVIY